MNPKEWRNRKEVILFFIIFSLNETFIRFTEITLDEQSILFYFDRWNERFLLIWKRIFSIHILMCMMIGRSEQIMTEKMGFKLKFICYGLNSIAEGKNPTNSVYIVISRSITTLLELAHWQNGWRFKQTMYMALFVWSLAQFAKIHN